MHLLKVVDAHIADINGGFISYQMMKSHGYVMVNQHHADVLDRCLCQRGYTINRSDKALFGALGLTLFVALILALNGPPENEKVVIAIKKPIADNRSDRVLSSLMDQTVSGCYYDLYQQNDTLTMNGDICNSAVMFFQQFCETKNLESCHSDYFKKYIKGMEG